MKKTYIDTHPKRDQIIRAIIKGEMSQRDIAKKYGIAKQTVTNYIKGKFADRAAKAILQRESNTGEEILKEIDAVIDRAKKMYDACDEYLTDPKRPDKYFLGPRADEVEIVYEEGDEDNIRRVRESLQNILDKLQGKRVSQVKYKYADPRELLLKTATVLNRQLELIARIQGEIKEQVQINIHNSPQFIQLQQVLIQATEKHPEVREVIISELNRINEESGK